MVSNPQGKLSGVIGAMSLGLVLAKSQQLQIIPIWMLLCGSSPVESATERLTRVLLDMMLIVDLLMP
jgi:hypothetical protein